MNRMVFFILIIVFTMQAYTQSHWSAWFSIGFGVSSFGVRESHWSKSGNVGLTVAYDDLHVKYRRRVNSEFTFGSSESQAKSHELIIGYSLPYLTTMNDDFSKLMLSINAGAGRMEQTINSISRSTFCTIAEVEFIIRPMRYIGITLSPFVQISKYEPIFGSHLNIIIGYW